MEKHFDEAERVSDKRLELLRTRSVDKRAEFAKLHGAYKLCRSKQEQQMMREALKAILREQRTLLQQYKDTTRLKGNLRQNRHQLQHTKAAEMIMKHGSNAVTRGVVPKPDQAETMRQDSEAAMALAQESLDETMPAEKDVTDDDETKLDEDVELGPVSDEAPTIQDSADRLEDEMRRLPMPINAARPSLPQSSYHYGLVYNRV